MVGVQSSFTDAEYAHRRKTTRRDDFLTAMDCAIPWQQWCGLIEPFYYKGLKGRKPINLETMLRMYLLQLWFHLSAGGAEDAIYDSYAMRTFLRIDFTREQAPDATTLLRFHRLLDEHGLCQVLFDAQRDLLRRHGWTMRAGTVQRTAVCAAPRDPDVRPAASADRPAVHA
ncbi:MAG: transposase [Propionibacteriaceae bacterium]|nr:transposase [Propionibacteriaceae bacterium]